MFNLFDKKLNTQDALLLTLKVALICYVEEKENGGIPLAPHKITSHVKDISNIKIPEKQIELIGFWVSKFLYEKIFITSLAKRAHLGPLGTLSASDEKQIEKIIPEAFN
jgi:hypothetical protein